MRSITWSSWMSVEWIIACHFPCKIYKYKACANEHGLVLQERHINTNLSVQCEKVETSPAHMCRVWIHFNSKSKIYLTLEEGTRKSSYTSWVVISNMIWLSSTLWLKARYQNELLSCHFCMYPIISEKSQWLQWA